MSHEGSLAEQHIARPSSGARRRLLLAITIGGALGAPARYAAGLVIPDPAQQLPVGTLAVNLSGALALGLLYGYLAARPFHRGYVRAALGIGFIGSYTTFSTYVVQIMLLSRHERYALAGLYLVLSLALGLTAVWGGVTWGRRLGAYP